MRKLEGFTWGQWKKSLQQRSSSFSGALASTSYVRTTEKRSFHLVVFDFLKVFQGHHTETSAKIVPIACLWRWRVVQPLLDKSPLRPYFEGGDGRSNWWAVNRRQCSRERQTTSDMQLFTLFESWFNTTIDTVVVSILPWERQHIMSVAIDWWYDT